MAEKSDARSLQPIGAGHKVDAVIQLILDRIETGQYRQGDSLVARNIAEELGTSVVPVREALNRLSGEGLVEMFSDRSARIKRLTAKELQDSIDVWETHAMLVVKLASQRISIRDNAERLRIAWEKVHSAGLSKDREAFRSCLRKCHRILKDICDNPYLDRVDRVLHTELWSRNVIDLVSDNDWDSYVKGFYDVGLEILKGNGNSAQKMYDIHIKWMLNNIIRNH